MHRRFLVTFLALFLPAIAGAQVTVYQNFDPDAQFFQPILNNEELGDDVTPATGTPRNIILFEVPITSTFTQNYTGTFTARFYLPDNDGLPGAKIFESALNVTDGVTGDRTLTFPVPNVLVPDYFIWSLQAVTSLPLDDPNDSLGLILNDNPTIGESDNFAFDNPHDSPTSEWIAYDYSPDPIVANFEATITAAVPEPGSLTLLGLCAAALLRRRQ